MKKNNERDFVFSRRRQSLPGRVEVLDLWGDIEEGCIPEEEEVVAGGRKSIEKEEGERKSIEKEEGAKKSIEKITNNNIIKKKLSKSDSMERKKAQDLDETLILKELLKRKNLLALEFFAWHCIGTYCSEIVGCYVDVYKWKKVWVHNCTPSDIMNHDLSFSFESLNLIEGEKPEDDEDLVRKQHQGAIDLFNLYLKEGAPYQVNVTYDVVAFVQKEIDDNTLSISTFDPVLSELRPLLTQQLVELRTSPLKNCFHSLLNL